MGLATQIETEWEAWQKLKQGQDGDMVVDYVCCLVPRTNRLVLARVVHMATSLVEVLVVVLLHLLAVPVVPVVGTWFAKAMRERMLSKAWVAGAEAPLLA